MKGAIYTSLSRESCSEATFIWRRSICFEAVSTQPRRPVSIWGRWDYLVCLHRSGQEGRYETWPRTLCDSLPRFWIPLDSPVPDVTVDLQHVFDEKYDAGAYARRIDYRREPTVGLTSDDAVRAGELLRNKGLR